MPLTLRKTQPEIVGALPPPPSITPNFVSPYTAQTAIIIVLVACLVITTVLDASRLYTKLYVIKEMGWEDRMWE